MFRSDQRRVHATRRRTGRRADGTRRVPATLPDVGECYGEVLRPQQTAGPSCDRPVAWRGHRAMRVSTLRQPCPACAREGALSFPDPPLCGQVGVTRDCPLLTIGRRHPQTVPPTRLGPAGHAVLGRAASSVAWTQHNPLPGVRSTPSFRAPSLIADCCSRFPWWRSCRSLPGWGCRDCRSPRKRAARRCTWSGEGRSSTTSPSTETWKAPTTSRSVARSRATAGA